MKPSVTPPRMTRRALGSMMVSAAALGALGSRTATAAPADIMVGEGISVGWATFYVADQLNTWNDAGLLAKTAMFPSGRHVLDAVAGGQVAIGTCAETPVVFANLNNVSIRIIGILNSYEPFSLVANTGIQKASDIAGKRIGYARGTNGHYYLSKLLKKYGMDMHAISAINLSPTDFVTSLINGSLDAFVWTEPMISAAVKNGAGKVHVLSDPGLYKTFSSIVTLDQTIRDQRPAMTDSLRALLAADKAIQVDNDKAVQIVSERLKIDQQVVRDGWAAPGMASQSLMAEVVGELNAQAEWAIAERLTRPDAQMMDFAKVVNSELLVMARKPKA